MLPREAFGEHGWPFQAWRWPHGLWEYNVSWWLDDDWELVSRDADDAVILVIDVPNVLANVACGVGVSLLAYSILRVTCARQLAPMHCSKCGYNLQGNESGRCPECGTPVGKNTLREAPRQ